MAQFNEETPVRVMVGVASPMGGPVDALERRFAPFIPSQKVRAYAYATSLEADALGNLACYQLFAHDQLALG